MFRFGSIGFTVFIVLIISALVGVSMYHIAKVKQAYHNGYHEAEIKLRVELEKENLRNMDSFIKGQLNLITEAEKDKKALQDKIQALATKTQESKIVYREIARANPMPTVCVFDTVRVQNINAARH